MFVVGKVIDGCRMCVKVGVQGSGACIDCSRTRRSRCCRMTGLCRTRECFACGIEVAVETRC